MTHVALPGTVSVQKRCPDCPPQSAHPPWLCQLTSQKRTFPTFFFPHHCIHTLPNSRTRSQGKKDDHGLCADATLHTGHAQQWDTTGPRALHTDFLEAARQTQTCRENAQLTGAVFQHLAQSQELGLVVGMSLSHIMKYLFRGQLQLLANGDPGRQKVMVQVIRFLPPVWESWVKFQASCFSR